MRMAHEDQIKQRLGVPIKLPKDFSQGPAVIDVSHEGSENKIYAAVQIVRGGGKKLIHRVVLECPGCGKVMSMGRFNQHYPCPNAISIAPELAEMYKIKDIQLRKLGTGWQAHVNGGRVVGWGSRPDIAIRDLRKQARLQKKVLQGDVKEMHVV